MRHAVDLDDAVRAERARLSEALHDDALQRLSAVGQDLEEAADGDPEALAAASRGVAEAIGSLRALVRASDEASLDAVDLATALERIAQDAARRGRFAPRVTVAADVDGVDDGFVLSIARELLANVARHSGAASAEVLVDVDDGHLALRVTDDGVGIAPGAVEVAARRGHLGHARLRRQVDLLGGTIAVDSSPEEGTVVEVRVRLERLRAQSAVRTALVRDRRLAVALAEALQDGLVHVTRRGVAEVNDRFCEMTGFSRDEVLGAPRGTEPYVPDDLRPAVTALASRTLREGRVEAAFALRRRDGGRLAVRISGRAVRAVDGRVSGLLFTVREDATPTRPARPPGDAATGPGPAAWLAALTEAQRRIDDAAGAPADTLLHRTAEVLADTLGFRSAAATADTAAAPGPRLLAADDDDLAWTPGDALEVGVAGPFGDVLGTVTLRDPASGLRPDADELALAGLVAAHAATAARRAARTDATARRRRSALVLLQATAELHGSRPVRVNLELAARALALALGAPLAVAESADGVVALRAAVVAHGPVADGLGAACGVAGLVAVFGGDIDAGARRIAADEVPRRVPRERIGLVGPGGLAAVPFAGPRGELRGVGWVPLATPSDAPDADVLAALTAFGRRTAIALGGPAQSAPPAVRPLRPAP